MQAVPKLKSTRGMSQGLAALFGFAALALTALPAAAQTAPSLTITDASGDPNSTQVAPGATLTVIATLNTGTVVGGGARSFSGLSYFIGTDVSAAGLFRLTDRASTKDGNGRAQPLPEIWPDAQVESSTNGDNLLTLRGNSVFPRNAWDLGYQDPQSLNDVPGGTFTLASLTLTAPSIAGTYTLRAVGASATPRLNSGIDEFIVTPNVYTVTVVPEPASAALVGCCVALLGLRRRARGAAAVAV